MKRYNVAVIGATGVVGSCMLTVMKERRFPLGELYLFASSKSAGKTVSYAKKDYVVQELTPYNIQNKKIDFALFAAGSEVAKQYAPLFAKMGCLVIDNSSYFRQDPNVPLVVPEVNPKALRNHNNIVANPNCSTIQAVVALAPLHKAYKLKRVVYSTYQAVSGAGIGGINDLQDGANGFAPKKFPHPIYDNLIPQIDTFLPDGYTKEEQKMIFETKKILEDDKILVTATTVRVPISNGHSESINCEFKKRFTLEEAKSKLAQAEGVILQDDIAQSIYPMPHLARDTDKVFVGRVRLDDTVNSGLNMFVVADNLRKGAATNAVQIALLAILDEKKQVRKEKYYIPRKKSH